MHKVYGIFYDGQSSQTYDAYVQNAGHSGLTITTAHKKVIIPWNEITVSSRLGNKTARYVDLHNLGRFETTDNDRLDQLLQTFRPQARWLHKLESSFLWVSLALSVSAGFVFSIIHWGVPAFSDYLAHHLPEQFNTILEEKIIDHLEETWLEPSQLTEAQQQGVFSLFDDIKHQFSITQRPYHLLIHHATKEIGANAFALPSGTIIITDQLITLADNKEQIAGVLAHELGHLEKKHSMRQLIRGSILSFLTAWISSDASGASTFAITAPVTLLQLRYSREFETEADQYTIQYFLHNKKNLEEMSTFFSKLSEKQSQRSDTKNSKKILSDFLSTHPSTESRIALFRKHTTKNSP